MNNKVSIGLFIDSYFPIIDGVVMVVDNYARLLSKYCKVTVFTAGAKGYNDSSLPYKVVRCKYIRLPRLGYSLAVPKFDKKFKRELKESNLDLVHIHSPFTIGKMGVKYALDHNIPLIATMHSQFKKDFIKAVKFEKIADFMLKRVIKVYNLCHKCWAVNEDVAKVYKEYGAVREIDVQHNGTDMKLITDKSLIEELKQKYLINNEKVLLFVGRINEIKNIFLILEALKILKDRNFQFKMFYIGDGPDLIKLKDKIKQYDLENEVLIVGKVEDRQELAMFYAVSDLFLFPSLYDCSSLVQIEAASQYTPTLFVYNSVTSNGIEENVTGYFSEDNAIAFASKIIDIFNDINLYDSVSKNVYKHIYRPWNKVVEKVYVEYLQILNDYMKYNTKQKE